MSALATALDPSVVCGALISASVQGGIALAVVWLICRVWRTMPGRVRCWLWRIAYVKLLAALIWTSPVRLAWLPAKGDAGTAEVVPSQATAVTIAMPVAPPSGPLEVVASTSLSSALDATRVSRSAGPTFVDVAFALWCFGAMIAGLRLVRHGRVASRLRRRSVLVDDAILYGRLAELARRFDLRPPRLLSGSDVPGPLLVGIFRPAIVLPVEMLGGEGETMELVLAHELAHLRRGDLWWTWLGAAVGVLFFFHPLVWVARREERAAEEMACDALAIGVSCAAAGNYARALLAVAARAFAPALALTVGVVSSRRVLEQRIIAMRHLSNWSRRRWTVVAAAALVLALMVIPPWRVVAQEKAADGSAASKGEVKGAAEAPAAGGERPMTVEERMRVRREQARAAAATEAASPRERQIVGSIAAATLRIQPAGDGLVDQVRVHEGDRVKKGDVLIQLDSRRAQAALARTEARLALAEAQFSRLRALVKEATVSREELDQKEAELKVAQADLNVAKQDLWEMRLMSPIDGTVGDLSVRAGERVVRGQTLVTVVETGALKFHASIPSSQLGVYAVGQSVNVRVPAYPEREFTAQISRVAPTVDPATATVRIEATLSGDTAGLVPGMFAKAALTPAEAKDGAKQP